MSSSSSPSSFLFIFVLICSFKTEVILGLAQNNNTKIPVKVGVVVDLKREFGIMSLTCMNMALSDFYASHNNFKTRLLFTSRDSHRDIVGAASAALDLMKNVQVQAIIGPETTMEANFMIELGDKVHVPIISFSASSASLTSYNSDYFVRATQNDSSQVAAISALVQAFEWREVVLVYVDNDYGQGIVPYLTDALQAVNVRVPYRSVISSFATNEQIEAQLYLLTTMQTRVFIIHMLPSLGSRVLTIAKNIGMMNQGYVWIMTDSMTNLLTTLNSSTMELMQGLLGFKPYVPRTVKLHDFEARWKRKFQHENPNLYGARMNIFCLRAYDAAFALAMAAEKAVNSSDSLTFRYQNNDKSTLSDLDSIGVSNNGPKLLEELLATSFKGLSGDFSLVDAQLQSSAFEIVNINENGIVRVAGFWTPDRGLVRNVNDRSVNLSSKSNVLRPIKWPGDSTSIPKGWELPVNEKKLRIGVPKKDGFTQFVKVEKDASNNTVNVTGYCIDIFDAVMNALPYVVPYDFIPYPEEDSEPNYTEMISQVYLKKFDAVVGDTTIRANRSELVDFTLPYTESGVSMIVPVTDNRKNTAWVFLKPLTWDLWMTTGCFFVFIGFVVWVLEHRINEDFRGPPSYQVGTSFWFSFSTMVFAHRERVVSNLARFVVIIWCFVVLILTQSYTASLASLLTVQQLQPRVTDVATLIKNKENVGYQEGTFVHELLIELGFDERRIKTYATLEEVDDLFTRGTKNGGIDAAFDELPYIRLLLAKYCSKYTMTEPTFKTAGFGFAFPKNSPLVPDISRAILNVTEDDKIKVIERKWLGEESDCPKRSTNSDSSSRLSLDSFWGLFLIVGIASTLALLIFTAMFWHEHVNSVRTSSDSTWNKIRNLATIFDKKDVTSHTFKKNERTQVIHVVNPIGSSPNTPFANSPSSYDHSFTASPERRDLSPNVQVGHEIEIVPSAKSRTTWDS